MGTNPGSLPLYQGQSLSPRDIQNALAGLPSSVGVRARFGVWLAVWATDTLAENEGQVLLIPQSDVLISSESLKTLYNFVKTFNANISFDLNTVFNYGKVSIVGDSDVANGITPEVEETIGEYCEVERISCRSSDELIMILRERIDSGIPFST
jgi:hypothetical protein